MAARRKRVTRQAEEGEEEETVLAIYEHGAEAADDVAADLQNGVREMVLFALEPGTVGRLSWSTAGFPTLASLDGLAEDQLFASLETRVQQQLLDDESAQTAVERGDGHLPAIRVKQARGRLPSVAQLAAVFDECVGPAKLEASTRKGYQAAWRLVITWGIAHECVGDLLPMALSTLKALTQELLMVGCAAGTIKNIWSGIEDRHRRFGHPLPLGGFGDFTRLYKAVPAVKGTPSRLIFQLESIICRGCSSFSA